MEQDLSQDIDMVVSELQVQPATRRVVEESDNLPSPEINSDLTPHLERLFRGLKWGIIRNL